MSYFCKKIFTRKQLMKQAPPIYTDNRIIIVKHTEDGAMEFHHCREVSKNLFILNFVSISLNC
jgi:hypothetical protein